MIRKNEKYEKKKNEIKEKHYKRKNKDKSWIYFEKSDFIFWIKKNCICVKFRMFSFPFIFQNTFQTVLRTV